jgi:hypothetical protein
MQVKAKTRLKRWAFYQGKYKTQNINELQREKNKENR